MGYSGSTGALPGGGYSAPSKGTSVAYAMPSIGGMKSYIPTTAKSFDYAGWRKETQPKAYEHHSFQPVYDNWMDKYKKKKHSNVPAPTYNLGSRGLFDVGSVESTIRGRSRRNVGNYSLN